MPAKPQSISIKTEHKPSGKWYWMEKRQQWGSLYYSFDSGDTWHKKRSEAFNTAKEAGRLWEVKEQNPMPAKKKTTRRKSSKAPSPAQLRARRAFALAAKARSKASKKKAGKKPVRRNSDRLTQAQIDALPYMQRVRVDNELGGAFLRKDKAYATKNANGTVTVHVTKTDGHSYTVIYDKKGKTLNPARRRNKTIITKPKKVVVINKLKNGKSTRRKYRNGYLDLVIMGHAKKTPQGWSLGGKTFKQGKGIVPASKRGYYLDLGTGTVFSKKARNVAQGFFDGNGVFHPIRSSADYDGGTAGETGRKPIRTRSKKRKLSLKKASQTAQLKAETRRRKSTTSRLASRSLSKSAGILKGSGSRRQRNPARYRVLDGDLIVSTGSSPSTALSSAKRKYAGTGASPRFTVQRRDANGRKWVTTKTSNPSVKTIRKEFAGTLGKASDVFAPIGTPRNVAKLGKLLFIDTESATIKPTGIVYLCADSKGKLHLCGSKNVPIYSGAAQSFGRVKKLEYETAKPHLYPGQGTIQFWHKMGEESGNQPTLYADGKGGLKFRGGSYKITREGIVD